MVNVSSILTMSTNKNLNNMYNQSALIRIAKQLFPEKNVFQLTKLEQREVLAIYNEFH